MSSAIDALDKISTQLLNTRFIGFNACTNSQSHQLTIYKYSLRKIAYLQKKKKRKEKLPKIVERNKKRFFHKMSQLFYIILVLVYKFHFIL